MPAIGEPTEGSRVREKCCGYVCPGLSSVSRAEDAYWFCWSSRGSHSSKEPAVLRVDEGDLSWEGHLNRCLLPCLTAISSMQDLYADSIRLGSGYRRYGSGREVCNAVLRECDAGRSHILPMGASISSVQHCLLGERPSRRRINHMNTEQCSETSCWFSF